MTKTYDEPVAARLRSTLALLECESAYRAKGTHPGMMRLADDEPAALLELLRREVVSAETEGQGR